MSYRLCIGTHHQKLSWICSASLLTCKLPCLVLALLMALGEEDEDSQQDPKPLRKSLSALYYAYGLLTSSCCWQMAVPMAVVCYDESKSDNVACMSFLATLGRWKLNWLPAEVLEHCKGSREQNAAGNGSSQPSSKVREGLEAKVTNHSQGRQIEEL